MTAINSNRAIRGPVTAVPVVAGKGVRLVADTVNNRWVVEADETVLWEGTLAPENTASLSETITNFENIEIFGYTDDGTTFPWSVKVATRGQATMNVGTVTTNLGWAKFLYMTISSGTTLSAVKARALTWGSSSWSGDSGLTGWRITKVVGINRVSGGN